MMNNHITDQARFCNELMLRIKQAVDQHEVVRFMSEYQSHAYLASYNGVAEAGAAKTQIQTDIVRLRRELSALSKMLED